MHWYTRSTLRDALNCIYSAWLARCLNCVKHIPLANRIKISTFVSLASSISSTLRCHSLRLLPVSPPRIIGPESVLCRVPLAPTQMHTPKRRRMILAAGRFKVENGMGLVHPGAWHLLRYYNRWLLIIPLFFFSSERIFYQAPGRRTYYSSWLIHILALHPAWW